MIFQSEQVVSQKFRDHIIFLIICKPVKQFRYFKLLFLRHLYLKLCSEKLLPDWKSENFKSETAEMTKNQRNILNGVVCWSSHMRTPEDIQLSVETEAGIEYVQKRTHKEELSAG